MVTSKEEKENSVSKLEAEIAALREKSEKRSEKADTVSKLQAELAALRDKSEKRSEKADTVSKLEAELAALREKSEKRSEKADTVSKLQAELLALKEKSEKRSTKRSEKADTVSKLEAELAELRMKSEKRSEKADTVSKLQAELAALKEKSEKRSEKADTVSKLKEELAALKEKSEKRSTKRSEKVDTVSKLEAELAELRIKSEKKSTRRSRKDDTILRLKEDIDALNSEKYTEKSDTISKLEAELAALKESSSVSSDSTLFNLERELSEARRPYRTKSTRTTESSSTIIKLKEEKERLERELAATDVDSLRTTLASKKRELMKKQYGIDICFLTDCTGSMGNWIREVKDKVREVISESKKFNDNGCVRVSFCGYRDLQDQKRFEICDFTELTQISSLENMLSSITADGGGDAPEDIVGGLREVLKLNWISSTRVLIHIADAPCHGSEYHNCYDDYPKGDPSGQKPEEFLEKLRKNVHYFFVEINSCTREMTSKFEKVYGNSSKIFQVKQLGDAPHDLLPAILESVKSSISFTMKADF